MLKVILIIVVIGIIAVSGFFLLSKPKSKSAPEISQPTPVLSDTITIQDCTANPQVLQVSEGKEITLVNADDEVHILNFFDFVSQGSEIIELPAGGSIKTTKLSTPKNSTNNFSCDQKTSPHGGAVYVRP